MESNNEGADRIDKRATRVRDVMDETFGKGKKLIKKKWKLDGTGIAEGNITAYIKRTGCVYLWDISHN